MSRTVLACLVLAAAIATPGIVVAATLSAPSASSEFRSSGPVRILPSSGVTVQHVPPIAPALRPAVRSVTAAFAAQGTKLVAFPLGATEAEAVSFEPGRRCQVEVKFGLGGHAGTLRAQGSCRQIVMFIGRLWIEYSPASAGGTIENALLR